MYSIEEISVPSIQSDWRGIVFQYVKIYYNTEPKCELCHGFNLNCEDKKQGKLYTMVIFTLYNKNSFPIYTEFVDSIAAIRSDGMQIDPLPVNSPCKESLENDWHIHSGDTIMPYSTQRKIVIYDNVFNDEKPIVKLDYRGCIYSKYERCNWGYASYNVQTNELLTNGSLKYIDRINAEYEKRKRDKLLVKPNKLLSELEVMIYKRNCLPTTYKEFTSLTTKIKGHIKELTELNKLNKLGLDEEIEKFNNSLDSQFSDTFTIFDTLKTFNITLPKYEITPEEFEHYVAEKFIKNGYTAEVTRYAIDGGIDIVLSKNNKTYGVQCKFLSENRFVDTVDMLHFLGALVNMRADGGFFVTTGKITAAGSEIADRNGITIITVPQG